MRERRSGRLTEPDLSLDRAVRASIGVLVAAAGVIHMAMVPMHTAHRPSMALFLVGGVAQLAVSASVLIGRGRAPLLAAATVSAGGVALWTLTRTTGVALLPGFETRQPIAPADLAATAFEIAAILAAGLSLGSRQGLGGIALPSAFGRQAISALSAASIVLLAASLTAPSDHSSHGHGSGEHGHLSTGHAHAPGDRHAPAAHVHAAGDDHPHHAAVPHAHAAARGSHTHSSSVHRHASERQGHTANDHGAHGHAHDDERAHPRDASDDHPHEDGHEHHAAPGATADDPHNIRGTCDPQHPYIADMLVRLKRFQARVPDMATALAGGWVPLGPVPNDFGYPDTYWHWVDWTNPPPGETRDDIVRPDAPQYLLMVPASEYDRHPDTMLWAVEGFMFAKAEPGRGPALYRGCNPFHTHSAEAGGFSGSLNEHFHVWPWHHIHPFAMNPPHLCTEQGEPVDSPYPFRDSWGCMS